MRTFRVRDQEEEFYMDGVGNVVLVTDGKRVWRREGRDKDSYSQEDVEELVRGEESGGTDHLLLSLLTHIHDSKMAELTAKVRAQELELRTLRRQLSLAPPVDPEDGAKSAQLQAALKGKSLLNPRVKRARTKGGLQFASDDSD